MKGNREDNRGARLRTLVEGALWFLAKRSETTGRFRFPTTAEETEALLHTFARDAVERGGRPYDTGGGFAIAIAEVAEWLSDADGRPWLYIAGCCGCGKTTVALSVKTAADYLIEAQAFPGTEYGAQPAPIMAKTATQVASDCANARQEFERDKRAAKLIVDDLGLEPAEEVTYGRYCYPLGELIESRYNDRKLTIFTTNMEPASIREKYGDRVADRMNEMCRVVRMGGGSRR